MGCLLRLYLRALVEHRVPSPRRRVPSGLASNPVWMNPMVGESGLSLLTISDFESAEIRRQARGG